MPSTRTLKSSDYRRSLWKNGLGHTDEIAIHPEGASLAAGNFLWRLSSARIERASPFSAFPHHDRTLVVLRGEGLRLTHDFEGDEERVDVPPFEPYEFPGDVPSRCELVGGPVTDLSVFVRKAEVEALTESWALSGTREWSPGGRWNFVFVAEGRCSVSGGGTAHALEAGDTLRIDLREALGEGEAWRLEGQARLVLVSLQG